MTLEAGLRRGMKGGCSGARVSHEHTAHTNYPWRAGGAAAAYKQPLDRAGAAAVNKQPPGALQTVTCATLLTLVAGYLLLRRRRDRRQRLSYTVRSTRTRRTTLYGK